MQHFYCCLLVVDKLLISYRKKINENTKRENYFDLLHRAITMKLFHLQKSINISCCLLATDSKVKIGEWIKDICYSSLLASRVKRIFILVFLLDHCLSCNFVPFDFNCQLKAYLSNMLYVIMKQLLPFY